MNQKASQRNSGIENEPKKTHFRKIKNCKGLVSQTGEASNIPDLVENELYQEAISDHELQD